VGSNSTDRDANRWTHLVVATLTRWAVARPSRCLFLALIFTLLGTAYSAWQLKFKTSRLDLLDTTAEYNQRWLRYLELFGRRDDAIIVIEADDPIAVAAALKDIGPTLEKDNTFSGILYSSATPQLNNKRLHFAPPETLAAAQQFLQLSLAINTSTPNPSQLPIDTKPSLPRSVTEPVFRATAASLSQQWLTLAQLQALPLLAADAQALLEFLNNPLQQPKPGLLTPLVELVANRTPSIDESLLLDDNGRLGLCLIPLLHPDDNPSASSLEINRLREHVHELKKRHPKVAVRLTGMPILEADEAQSTQSDMMVASIVSMLGVAVLLVVAYGSITLPLLAMLALLFGLLWTLTFATVSIGHLNLLSAAFGAILIGLGIDFSIHFLSHFLEHLRANSNSASTDINHSLLQTAKECGAGIWIGAISTAAAFACAAVTPFKGIAELGVISGGGTLICMLAALTILPASLALYYRRKSAPQRFLSNQQSISGGSQLANALSTYLAGISSFAIRNPIFIIALSIASVAMTFLPAWRCRFDHNLLNLQAEGIDSVKAENTLIEKSTHSTWYAISLASTPEQAIQLADRYAKLDRVSRVDYIANLVADPFRRQRTQQLGDMHKSAIQLETIALKGYSQHTSRSELQAVLAQLQRTGDPTYQPVFAALNQRLENATAPEIDGMLREFETSRQGLWLYLLEQLKSLTVEPPPEITDLPTGIKDRLWHTSGTYQIRVFPKGDVWDREPLELFVKQLESVDPQVTGHPVQTYYASGELQDSYRDAALYALLAVSIILLFNFRQPALVVVAMLPALCALVSLLGLMSWCNMPLNPANMIALPLVLGIGVDDGVHLTEQFRQIRGKYHVSNGTTTALMLTSVSTMLGFGSLMVAHHQGLFSLGWVLTVGIGFCWVYSVLLLPAIFSLYIRMQRKNFRKRTAKEMTDSANSFADSTAAEATSARRSDRTLPRRRSSS